MVESDEGMLRKITYYFINRLGEMKSAWKYGERGINRDKDIKVNELMGKKSDDGYYSFNLYSEGLHKQLRRGVLMLRVFGS